MLNYSIKNSDFLYFYGRRPLTTKLPVIVSEDTDISFLTITVTPHQKDISFLESGKNYKSNVSDIV